MLVETELSPQFKMPRLCAKQLGGIALDPCDQTEERVVSCDQTKDRMASDGRQRHDLHEGASAALRPVSVQLKYHFLGIGFRRCLLAILMNFIANDWYSEDSLVRDRTMFQITLDIDTN